MAFAPIPASHANVSAGKLRALAVTSLTRSSLLPEVPTMMEAGLSGFDASLYYGLVAPSGTPRPIVDKLNAALRHALNDARVKKTFSDGGMDIFPANQQSPEAAATLLKSELKLWGDVIKSNNITPAQ